jgi:C4-type Zn-finger protein
VATKERVAAMADSRCALCSAAMMLNLVREDPHDSTLELRTYVCADCGHSQTYSVEAGAS